MKIKEIKLYGFKSFPGETKIMLDQGITAFVGPNGSGKSNIFDALRWVFGEQSMKALRCEKIEDLIYVSPDTRNDANFTEISITIENEDFFPQFGGEFEIKRKFYRSGESEFYLNRVKCRLQDIQALFLNSGTLTYSFLELSEIEKIIHGNTKEMFDDVSGILKYQERREQTKRRLESTEQDLLRLEDIIHEMQRSLRSLRRQVRQTTLFQELKEEYKVLTLLILKNDFKISLDELTKIQEQRSSIEAQRQSIMQEIKVLEEKREELKEEMAQVENTKKDTLSRIAVVDELLEELLIKINNKEVEARQITLANERIITSIKEKKESLLNARNRLEEYGSKKVEIIRQIDQIKTSIQMQQEELEAVNTECFSLAEALKEKDELIVNHQADAQAYRNQLTKLRFEKENKETILARISEEYNTQQVEIDTSRRSMKQLEDELDDVIKEQAELSRQLEQANSNLTNNEKKLDELENDLGNRQDDLTKCKLIVDTLIHRLKEKSSVKEIAENFKNRNEGLLRDNITVTSDYESVIDICLGDILNYYLIYDYKANDFSNIPEGRFGFINVKASHEAESSVEITEGLTPVAQFVEFKSSQTVLQKLLTDYFLVEDFDKAQKLSSKYHGCGFVTSDGILIKNGVIITERGEIGFFRISQRLEEYEGRFETLKNEILFVNEEKKRLITEQKVIKNQLDEENNRLFKTDIRKSERSMKLNELKRHLEKVSNEYDGIGNDKKAVRDDIERILGEIHEIETRIKETEETSNKIKDGRRGLIENSQDIERNIKDQNTLLNEKKMEAVVCNERFNSIVIRIEQLKSEIVTMERDIGVLKQDRGATSLDEVERQIARLKEEMESKKSQKIDIEAVLPEKLIENLTHHLNEIFDQLAEKQKSHEEIQNRIMQLKYKIFQLNHKKDEAWKKGEEEFSVDLRDYIPEEDIPDAESRLVEVRGKLEKLGEVNPLSLELYENEKKRLDEFFAQRDDIITAKSSLLRSIDELDTRARERFVTIFDEVKKEFNFVFSKFFEGGQADLVLSDPSNPLISKIDIAVRMKGKRLKVINQLSGGERTLLAVSLLLALYLVKPAPFCILDEIDAPLDDANVVRFNKFLRDLSQRTQVVIITHNRATMEYADYLYGLTMEKPGQSKIISAKLADLEKLNLDA